MAPVTNPTNDIAKALRIIFDDYKYNDNINIELIKELTKKPLDECKEIYIVLIDKNNITLAINKHNIILLEYLLKNNYEYSYSDVEANLNDLQAFSKEQFLLYATNIFKLIADRADNNHLINRKLSGDYKCVADKTISLMEYACKYGDYAFIEYTLSVYDVRNLIKPEQLRKLVNVSDSDKLTKLLLSNSYTFINTHKLKGNKKYIVNVGDCIYALDHLSALDGLRNKYKNITIKLVVPIIGNKMIVLHRYACKVDKVVNNFGKYSVIDFVPQSIDEYFRKKYDTGNYEVNMGESYIYNYDKMVMKIKLYNIDYNDLANLDISWF